MPNAMFPKFQECAFEKGEWIALRTRPDKTSRIQPGSSSISGAANNWMTAMSVWNSMEFTVSEDVIRRTADCPVEIGPDNDLYYARREFTRRRSMLRSMADFHNLCVKATLYKDASSGSGAQAISMCPPNGYYSCDTHVDTTFVFRE